MHIDRRFGVRAIALAAAVLSVGCSGSAKSSGVASAGGGDSVTSVGGNSGAGGVSGGSSVTTVSGPDLLVSDDGGVMADSGVAANVPNTLPAGFTAANTYGGYMLGAPIASGGASGSAVDGGTGGMGTDGCGTTILAVIRDFQADHMNFEGRTGDDRGLVQPTLGADRKPVYAPAGPTRTVADPAQFDSWYRNVDGLNQPFTLELWFGPNNGISSFGSTAFFPLDGQGYGNDGNDAAGTPHNFHFTTEIHTAFKYNGGEQFNFAGDDDVWVFINNQLAIDLGGVHSAETASVNIDMQAATLGLTKGQVYPFDMFQNERHTTESNFRADTDLEFVNCGTIVPEVK